MCSHTTFTEAKFVNSLKRSSIKIGRKLRQLGHPSANEWKVILMLVGLVVTAEAQTFQYSRGWTNGKRSGEGSGVGMTPNLFNSYSYDLENSPLSAGANTVEPVEVLLPPRHLQMSLNPSGRFRNAEIPQYLVKRTVATSSTAKKPYWFGTIWEMDGTESGNAAGVNGGGAGRRSPPASVLTSKNENQVPIPAGSSMTRSTTSDF